MGTEVDSLELAIETSAKQANRSLTGMVSRLNKVEESLKRVMVMLNGGFSFKKVDFNKMLGGKSAETAAKQAGKRLSDSLISNFNLGKAGDDVVRQVKTLSTRIANEISQNGISGQKTLLEDMDKLGSIVAQNGTIALSASEDYQRLYEYIRAIGRIKISPENAHGLGDDYKNRVGILKQKFSTKEGTELDSIYQEMKTLFPGILHDANNVEDEFYQLNNALEQFYSTVKSYEKPDWLEDAVYEEVSNGILDMDSSMKKAAEEASDLAQSMHEIVDNGKSFKELFDVDTSGLEEANRLVRESLGITGKSSENRNNRSDIKYPAVPMQELKKRFGREELPEFDIDGLGLSELEKELGKYESSLKRVNSYISEMIKLEGTDELGGKAWYKAILRANQYENAVDAITEAIGRMNEESQSNIAINRNLPNLENIDENESRTTTASAKSFGYNPEAMEAVFGKGAKDIQDFSQAVEAMGGNATLAFAKLNESISGTDTSRIYTLENVIKKLKKELEDLSKQGLSQGDKEYDQKAEEIALATEQLRQYNAELKKGAKKQYADDNTSTFQKLKNALKGMNGELKKNTKEAGKFWKSLKKIKASGMEKARKTLMALRMPLVIATSGFKKLSDAIGTTGKKANRMNLGKMMLSSIAFSTLFGIISAIKQAIADGSNNLVQYSEAYNRSISGMVSSLLYLKNAWAAAFAPIVNVVSPYISAFIDMLAGAMNTVAQFFAALTGKQIATVAKKNYKDYGASIADTSKAASDGMDKANESAKKLNKTILGFDELNVLNAPDTSSNSGNGGSGSGGINAGDILPADMFEDIPIKKSISDFAKKLKSYIKAEDWAGLGKYMADGINKGLQKVYDAISWDNVGPKITKFCNAFTTTFNSLVDNVDWDLLGRTVGAGVNTIVNTANLLLTGINWKNLGAKFADGIMGIIREVNWNNFGQMLGNAFMVSWNIFNGAVHNLKFSEIGSAIANGLNGMFSKISFSEIADTLTTGINGAFDALAQFTKDFEWNDFTKNLGDGISKFISEMHWKDNGKALGDFLKHLCDAINGAITNDTFHDLGVGIGDFIGQLPWGTLLKTAGHLLITGLLSAIGGVFEGLSDEGLGGKIAAFLGTVFVGKKIMEFTGLDTLAGNIIGKIGEKIAAEKNAELIASKLSDVLGTGASGVEEGLETIGEIAGKSSSKFGMFADSLLPLVGTAGLIVAVGAAAAGATSQLAKFVEGLQGGNEIGGTFGNTMDNFIQTLEQDTNIIPDTATEIWKLKESLEQEDMTADDKASATQKLIDKLGEAGVTSDQARLAFDELNQQGLITDDMFNILSKSIETLGDKTTNTASQIDLSKYSVDDLDDVVRSLKDQLHLTSEQWGALDTALYDMPNASGTAQGAFENIMQRAEEMGINTESVAKIFAKAFPDAVKQMETSTSTSMGNAAKSVQDASKTVTTSTNTMKTTAMSDYEAIHKAAETSSSGVSTATVTNWGNSATEVSKNLDQMKQAANLKLGEMQKTVDSHFSSQYNTITTKWQKATERIVGKGQIIDSMDSALGSKVPTMAKHFSTLASRIKQNLSGLESIGRNAANNLKNGFESVYIKTPHIQMNSSAYASGNNMSYRWDSSVKWYANGGFPKMGEMFIANEKGPEMVGRMGNKNVVANNNQIATAIRDAVVDGMMEVMMSRGNGNSDDVPYVINAVLKTEDDEVLAKAVERGRMNRARRMNPSPVY